MKKPLNQKPPIGVLVMAHGGVASVDEVPGYLANIRAGRTVSQKMINAVQKTYQAIGGCSPLLKISQEQVAAIQAQLNPKKFRCYLGTRYWSPWIEETIEQMINDGITQAVSIVLAPQYSNLSVAKYLQQIKAGLRFYRGDIQFQHITHYYDEPLFIKAMVARLKEGLALWGKKERDTIHVVFSAHSLPERVIAMKDPYPDQVKATAALIADKAKLSEKQWSFCFQSAGSSPEPWLGPQLENYLVDLAKQGEKQVLSCPVGFVSDHSETLFDIDIHAKSMAKKNGITLHRAPALNCQPLFIKSLVGIIKRRAKELPKW